MSQTLRNLFVLHFVVDVLFAVPLFVAPVYFLEFLQFKTVDPIAARLVAAALFAIGGKSFLEKNASVEVYKSMLSLKIIWSFFAAAGLLYALVAGEFGSQFIGWGLFGVFAVFHFIWLYWRKRLG